MISYPAKTSDPGQFLAEKGSAMTQGNMDRQTKKTQDKWKKKKIEENRTPHDRHKRLDSANIR